MDVATLLARYDLRVPRYTSYPTAAQFGPAVGVATYAQWLRSLPADTRASIYLHVPFCDELCLYCGCHTAVVRREAPLRVYAEGLRREITAAAGALARRPLVSELHWGGGTPTALPPNETLAVMATVREHFDLAPDTPMAIELDPRHLSDTHIALLRQIGINRASIGVQDIDPAVQHAIGRIQPYELVEHAVLRLRDIGIDSINMDLIYGLPMQTETGVRRTAERLAELRPARIAAFGYAHVPWMKKQQRLICELTLPGPAARFAQRAAIEATLCRSGYRAIGLDHFALPGDSLAQAADRGELRRNFQGYTTDTASVLLGFGASAIGKLPQGYVQNEPGAAAYLQCTRTGGLATARGVALTATDRLRADVIAALMCDGAVDLHAAASHHDADPAPLLADSAALLSFARDGLVDIEEGRIRLTQAGRPFMRSVAAVFDAYWDGSALRHASSV